jgi:hypothetical protein
VSPLEILAAKIEELGLKTERHPEKIIVPHPRSNKRLLEIHHDGQRFRLLPGTVEFQARALARLKSARYATTIDGAVSIFQKWVNR